MIPPFSLLFTSVCIDWRWRILGTNRWSEDVCLCVRLAWVYYWSQNRVIPCSDSSCTFPTLHLCSLMENHLGIARRVTGPVSHAPTDKKGRLPFLVNPQAWTNNVMGSSLTTSWAGDLRSLGVTCCLHKLSNPLIDGDLGESYLVGISSLLPPPLLLMVKG